MKRKTKRPLPPSCSLCRPLGGNWRQNDDGSVERCDCPRGRALAAGPAWNRPDKLAHDGRMAGAGA